MTFVKRAFCLFLILLCFPAAQAIADRAVPLNEMHMQLSFSPLVKKVSPAVVNIYTQKIVSRNIHPFANDPFFKQFFGNRLNHGIQRERVENALGSGVILAADGLIVTNAHVIRGATEIIISLADGREFEAEIVLVDKPSDLALLKINTNGERLPSVELKPSESLEVGDLVLAIGNPFGVGQTVTSGIVSAQGRASLNINDFNFFIQTDAAINPGNSGGPLVAMDGGVVGINTAIFSRSGGSLGIGFAVPSEMLATVIAAYESGQSGEEGVIRPWLGIRGQPVTSDIARSLGLESPYGVLVVSVHAESPLRKVGIKQGDLITKINGRLVREPAELKFRMATVPLGQSAVFTVMSGGKEKEYKIKAIAPPDKPDRDERALQGAHPMAGAVVMNLNPKVAIDLGLPISEVSTKDAVVLTGYAKRSRISGVLRAGDIIVQINGEDITSTTQLEKMLSKQGRRDSWQIIIERDGRQTSIVIR